MKNYISRRMAVLAVFAGLAGCQVPVKGDASIFQGDKSRTLEARVKVGNDGPGLFVRERLTTPDYKDQSIVAHFALADVLYARGNFAALVGTRSSAKFDVDNIGGDLSTGHIDPRVGGFYTAKAGDWMFFANPTTFANVYPGQSHNIQLELNTTVGFQPKLTDKVSLDIEAENILLMDRGQFKQAIQRLRGGVSYKGVRAGIGTDMVETDKKTDPTFNTGLYIGIRF